MRYMTRGSVVLLTCLLLVSSAQASIIFQLTDSAGVEQSNFVIGNIGQTVDVNVWLRQTDPDTVLTDEGLSFAGVKLTYGLLGIAEVPSEGYITPNPAFDDPTGLITSIGSDYVTLDMAADMFGLNFPVFPQSSTPDRIWLGTFTFKGLGLGNVQITAMDNPDLDNTLTGLGTVLDSQIGSVQATVSTVPEPSGLVIFAGFVLIAGPYLWHRRRRATCAA